MWYDKLSPVFDKYVFFFLSLLFPYIEHYIKFGQPFCHSNYAYLNLKYLFSMN